MNIIVIDKVENYTDINDTIYKLKQVEYKGNELPYLISEFGHVYNMTGHRMAQFESTGGYIKTPLRIETGRTKSVPVHVLVASTYIPNPKNLPVVNHKDGNKHNNHISNLEWVTHAENTQHAYRTGLMHGNGHKTFSNEDVEHICELLQVGTPINDICIEFGLDPSNPSDYHKIWSIRNGRRWSNISCKYTFPPVIQHGQRNPFNNAMSEDRKALIVRICEEIEKTYPNTNGNDILIKVGLEKNKKNTNLISDVKRRVKYREISKEYNW